MPVLSRAIIDFEKFMTAWEDLGEKYQVLKPWTDIGMQWATKYYVRMDDTKAYVVAMCKSFNWLITALVANFTLQSSILSYVSRGSKGIGMKSIKSARRKSF